MRARKFEIQGERKEDFMEANFLMGFKKYVRNGKTIQNESSYNSHSSVNYV